MSEPATTPSSCPAATSFRSRFRGRLVPFLRTNPASASAAFPVIAGDDLRTIVFASGRGLLDSQVFEDRQLVVIDELSWLDD